MNKRFVFLIITISMLIIPINISAVQTNENTAKKVLLLFSGNHEDKINYTIFSTLNELLPPNNIQITAEYVGGENSVFYHDKDLLVDFLKVKYGENERFDLVMAFNKEALDLCMDYSDDIFPETNILIIDIYGQAALFPPFGAQLQIIEELHKDLDHLLVIIDSSDKAKKMKENFQEIADSSAVFKDKIVYLDYKYMAFEQLSKYKYYSNQNNAILILSAYQDMNEYDQNFINHISFIDQQLNLPIYTFYEQAIDTEVVGGYYLDVESLVKQLSIKILLILNEMPILQIEFGDMRYFQMFFNKKAVDKYNLDIDDYLEEAEIYQLEDKNDPLEIVIETLKRIILGTFFVSVILLIIAIIKIIKQKKEINNKSNILKAIFEKSFSYILIIDVETGEILNYNQKVAKSTFSDYINQNETNVTELFPEKKIKKILKFEERDSVNRVFEIDFTSPRISFPALMFALTFQDMNRKVAYLQFINYSEYESKISQLKKEKEEAEGRVHESSKLIENFVREVRKPINVKRGFVKLLEQEKLSDKLRRQYLEIVHQNSHVINGLVEKILAYTELKNNPRVLHNTQFYINEEIRSISKAYQGKIKAKNKELELVNYFSLTDGRDIIFNDKEYFRLVFRELIENAVNFTDSGIIECGYTHPNDGKIIFYVKDSGRGMTIEEQRIAFNKFLYPSDTNNSNQGIGLGLAICREIVSMMGGNIWLTSNYGEGVTVYLHFDYDISIFRHQAALLSDVNNHELSTKKILIIDEDLGNQKFIKNTLARFEIHAKSIPNYLYYKKRDYKASDYDIILIDENSGLEDLIRERLQDLVDAKVLLVIVSKRMLEDKLLKKITKLNHKIIYKPIKLHDLFGAFIGS